MQEGRREIVAAARGDEPVDLVVRGVELVNVFTAEIYAADVGIKGNRFAAVARYEGAQPAFHIEGVREVNAQGMYAMPGFFDAHVHVESTMVTPDMFARAVLRHGTTAAVTDPHEIGNVLGAEGVRYMVEASQGLPVRLLTTVPSCVPAVPGLETAGAEFTAQDIDALLGLPGVVGIAELMDYPGVVNWSTRMASIVEVGLERGVLNEGHAPRVTGRWLQAYLAAGVNSDHESRTPEEIMEKLRAGMILYIRESSVSKFADVAARAWAQLPHAAGFAMCTDDVEPDDMLRNGHMNRVVRRAIESGIPAPLAIRYATLNGAQRYRLWDLGAVAPGYLADLVLVESLETMRVSDVYVEGLQMIADGELTAEIRSETPPLRRNTMCLPGLTEEDFSIEVPVGSGKVGLTTIEVTPLGTTARGTVEVISTGGRIRELPPDHVFLSVTGRHGQGRKPFVGVLKGSGLRGGAYATTVAHDSHNLLVAGTNAADMLLAARTLEECGGGICLTQDEQVLAKIELPIAGLMAAAPVEEMSTKVEAFNAQARAMGISVARRAPTMALSGLTLTVTPEIRISDLGLVDVEAQTLTPLLTSAG